MTMASSIVGEYNCFLNVNIQSLWRLRRFQDEFMTKISQSQHKHIGYPCVVCELHQVFTAMNKVSEEAQTKAVDTTLLSNALSKVYRNSNFFQKGQNNDATKVLEAIFECIHESFTCTGDCDAKAIDNDDGIVKWVYGSSNTCIAHDLFSMNIYEMINCACGLKSMRSEYTQFFLQINEASLRNTKVKYGTSSFGEIIKKLNCKSCDPDLLGCGNVHHNFQYLSSPPHFFAIVLSWQSMLVSLDDLSTILEAIAIDVDFGVHYCGVDQGCRHSLVSVISFHDHYSVCCAYNSENKKWFKHDGLTEKVIGDWGEVRRLLLSLHLQPQILVFEAVS